MWTAVSQLLRAQVSDAVWFSTFQDVRALPADGGYVRIGVPNTVVREKILHRYLPLVRDALDEIGASSRQLLVDVDADDLLMGEDTGWAVPGTGSVVTAPSLA